MVWLATIQRAYCLDPGGGLNAANDALLRVENLSHRPANAWRFFVSGTDFDL